MRVCLVGSSGVPIPPQFGGAVERHIFALGNALVNKGCEVDILTMRPVGSPKEQPVEHVCIHRGGFFQENPSIQKALLKHLTFFLFVFFKLMLIETDIIHAHNGIPGLAAIVVSKARRIPFVFTCHTPYSLLGHQIFAEEAAAKGKFEDFQVMLEKFCAKKSCFTIAVSKRVRDELVSMEVPAYRVLVVPNGVDTRQFTENPDEASRVRKKFLLGRSSIVLYVGRIVRYKGLDALVNAASSIVIKHPGVKFVITGPVSYYQSGASTSYYRELKEKIELLQLSEFFVFTGAVSEEDLVGLYSACDMLVLPSLSEAFGMVLAEAMSCGKPVIGSRIGGIADVINDGKDGYLIPAGRSDGLASKVTFLLERPEERKRMGGNAALHVRNEFDWGKIAKRIMEIYDKAIRD